MLKFIDSPDEKCLRSVGDPPNGVVTFMLTADQIGVAVSGKYEPTGGPSATAFDASGDDPFDSQMIDTVEAVAALAGEREALILWAMATTSVQMIVSLAIQQPDFDRIRLAVDGAEELYGAIADRFGS